MRRALVFFAILAFGAAGLTVAACTEGTTPDCRNPSAGCGPGVDAASGDASEGGAADVVSSDAPVDSARDAPSDAPSDAPADASDAGSDAALDADAQAG
jgi:hypothetical protein